MKLVFIVNKNEKQKMYKNKLINCIQQYKMIYYMHGGDLYGKNIKYIFKDNKKTGDVLPYDDYPMLIEEGQYWRIFRGTNLFFRK